MNNFNSSLGFYIPNSDYDFQAKRVVTRDDFMFVITQQNEVIVLKRIEDSINKISDLARRYILFTHPQSRADIFDILLVKLSPSLMSHNKKVIVTISDNLIINFWNVKDGLCLNKVNLSNYKRKGEILLSVFSINERFLLFIFLNKSFLFDGCSLLIVKEEKFSFNVNSIYKMKENKFMLLSELKDTYLMEIQHLPLNYSDHLQCKFNYEEVRYRLLKHTFRVDKVFNEETMYALFSKQDFIFHNLNQTLKVSFLDSVEEISELSSITTGSKFKIIFLDILILNDEEHLVVVYKDLTCDLFIYDKKSRELKRLKRFTLMVEDEYLNMRYAILDSGLIGYMDNSVQLFDMKRFRHEDEKYVDRTIYLSNIFGKKNKKLFFSNYFLENFSDYSGMLFDNINASHMKLGKDYFTGEDINKVPSKNIAKRKDSNFVNETAFKITASTIFSHHENNSIYSIIGTNTGKVAIIDIFFNEQLGVNPLFIMDYHTAKINSLSIIENKYLIAASEDGVITFTDISKEKVHLALEKSLNTLIENMDVKNIQLDGPTKNLISNMNYYYSKRKSLTNITDDFLRSGMLVNEEKKEESSLKVIQLLPIHTIKSYHKLKRILSITQLDNYQVSFDENFKRKQKNLLGFEMEDNSVNVINIENLKTIYNFNLNSHKHSIKAIYHISYQKTLIFFLDNNTIKITNYATKTADRTVSDVNKIYSMLLVEDKLKMYFMNSENILSNDFSSIYTQKEDKKENKEESQNYQYYHNESSNGHSQQTKHDISKGITIELIRDNITNENYKKIFIEKYIHNTFNKRKSHLNITQNKFESSWIKRIELLIIDDIFEIINSYTLTDKLKKISIMNLLFNPSIHYKIFDRYDNNSNGIESNILHVGNQVNEYLLMNFEEYFLFIEKIVHDQKRTKNHHRVNYYNFISLFHIWNLSLDQDINMINFMKIYQPIFEFNFILRGHESGLSLILNQESDIDGDLNGHFKFFMEYMKADEGKIKVMKTDKMCNKNYVLKSQQGYLTNLKNYKFSTNLSHLMNLAFFGSMIAVLGFEESNEICKIMASEKMLYRSLALQKFTLFTNLNAIDKHMYETIDDIALANKDIILVDYLHIKNNLNKSLSNSVVDFNTSNHSFTDKLYSVIQYLEKLYMFIFSFENEDDISHTFYKMNKDKNVEFYKLNILSEFDLSLINLAIMYNSIADEKDKLEEAQMFKITQLLVLFVFKILNPSFSLMKNNYSKIIVELLSKCTDYLEKVYSENVTNYTKFLIDLYTSVKIPIDLDGLFKKYEIGNCIVIKSEDNYNFLKIMLAKLLKNFSKLHISFILKIIVEEFKRKTTEYDYFSYMLEILWILFREKNPKYVNFLPPLINLIMTTMSPQNKDMRNYCLDNAKKVLSCLLPNYPMISFHQNSQKLAVGANDGKVYIYDLTTGNIWKNLNAHTNEITALSFDFTGNILISYSSTEYTVKFWKIGLTNFFSNFFSMKDGYYKSVKFDPIQAEIKPEERVNITKFQLMPKNDNKVVLIREDKSVEVLSL